LSSGEFERLRNKAAWNPYICYVYNQDIFLINYPVVLKIQQKLIPLINILAGELSRAFCATRGPAMRPSKHLGEPDALHQAH
jgi:hypothetical protein